jgi:hypothetical protein
METKSSYNTDDTQEFGILVHPCTSDPLAHPYLLTTDDRYQEVLVFDTEEEAEEHAADWYAQWGPDNPYRLAHNEHAKPDLQVVPLYRDNYGCPCVRAYAVIMDGLDMVQVCWTESEFRSWWGEGNKGLEVVYSPEQLYELADGDDDEQALNEVADAAGWGER